LYININSTKCWKKGGKLISDIYWRLGRDFNFSLSLGTIRFWKPNLGSFECKNKQYTSPDSVLRKQILESLCVSNLVSFTNLVFWDHLKTFEKFLDLSFHKAYKIKERIDDLILITLCNALNTLLCVPRIPLSFYRFLVMPHMGLFARYQDSIRSGASKLVTYLLYILTPGSRPLLVDC
jgi:hypothetical protein